MMRQGEVVAMRLAKGKSRSGCKTIFLWLLGILQVILSLAIIGLESASIYYDAGRGTIYAGFWCSIVFFVTWISMFCFLCCGKSNRCGIYLLIQNAINLIFAVTLTVFTILFINEPCLCYGDLCNIRPLNFYPYFGNYCTTRTLKKVPVLKALLACAVTMVVCNLIFIFGSCFVCIVSRRKSIRDARNQSKEFSQLHPSVIVPSSDYYEQLDLAQRPSEPNYYYAGDTETTPQSTAPHHSTASYSEYF